MCSVVLGGSRVSFGAPGGSGRSWGGSGGSNGGFGGVLRGPVDKVIFSFLKGELVNGLMKYEKMVPNR